MMRRSARFWFIGLLAACSGPPAPDAELCRDIAHRLCLTPVCAEAVGVVTEGAGCEEDAVARAGCDRPEFAFTPAVPRERVLSCRLPLLRQGSGPDVHPSCDDVYQMVTECTDVVGLFQVKR